MKKRLWHRWLDEAFPDNEAISVDELKSRLVDYCWDNNKKLSYVPFKSAMTLYLKHNPAYKQVTNKSHNNSWRKESFKECEIREQMGLSKLERLG